MTYYTHLIANLRVSRRCLWLAGMHMLHGLIPCEWTSHEWWERIAACDEVDHG